MTPEHPALIDWEWHPGAAPDRPQLIRIDRTAAEALIQQTRGITGARGL